MNTSHNDGTRNFADQTEEEDRRRALIAEALEPDFCLRFARQILDLEAINSRGQTLTTSAERACAHLQEVGRRYEESSIHDPRSARSQHVDLSDACDAVIRIMLECMLLRSEICPALQAAQRSGEKAMLALREYQSNAAPNFNRLRISVICNDKPTTHARSLITSIDQLENFIAGEQLLLQHIWARTMT